MGDYTYSEKDKFTRLVGKENYHERIAQVKGEAFRQYRQEWDSAGRFEIETPVPLHVDFELSTYCNYRCPMCPFGVPKESRPSTFGNASGWFPFELFQKVIDDGVKHGLRAIDLSYYNEPLLRKDLLNFIDYAQQRGVLDIMFSTNGELLTPEITERLLDSGLTRFMVSLDADTEGTFEHIRIGGHFQKVVENFHHFLRRKKERGQILPITRTSFVKTKLNESELEGFLTRWKELVDYISVQELMEFDEMKLQLTPQNRVQNSNFRCHQPWHRLTLRANGDALPCCTIWGQHLPMGNVKDQSLQEIWMSPPMVELRRQHRDGRYRENAICKKCAESSVSR
jgi:radical SAM protein with 4Fe4S-binding SPASM domain